MLTARPALADDLADLERLWSAALADLEGRRGGRALGDDLHRPDLAGYLAGALASPDHLLVLGALHGSTAGLASVRARRHLRHPVADMELIYVEPPARRSGLAGTMLDVVTDRAQAWGMTGIDGPALPGDRGAKSFFEASGLTARLLVMHRPLPDPPGGRPG